jgi:hypothetical protein
MSNVRCAQCGLVSFASAQECKRCGAALEGSNVADASEVLAVESKRGVARRILAGLGLSAFILFGWYISLLETSQAASYDERQLVRRAVEEIERAGLVRDAFLLRRLTSYRTNDNWWNCLTGHDEAYAATNFPFEIVTLYPEFFKYATDDTERAVILMHEARHLAGSREEEALRSVWRDKYKLGWTREKYGQTRVWKNVNDSTRRLVPQLFRCGEDGQQDCSE